MKTIYRRLRRAFTIVELVVVIAVIAVLAAILIPTFMNVVNSANNSSDEQTVKNMNTALQIYEVENDNNKPTALCTVWEVIEEAGYNSQPTPNYSDNEFYWYKTDNRVLIYSISEAQVIFPAEYAGVKVSADGNASNYKTVSAKYKASTSVENGVIDSAEVLSLNIDKTDSAAHDSNAETTGRCLCCGDTVAVKVDSTTIAERLTTVEDLGSITLESDIDMTELAVDFKTVSIDLNGYTISTSGLYIEYYTEEGEPRPEKDVEVVIENGTIKQSGDVNDDFGLIFISYGAVTLKNVEIIADSGNIALWNSNGEYATDKALTISDCSITGMIWLDSDSVTYIDGGTYTANTGDLYIINNYGTLTVTAGTFYVSDLPEGTGTMTYKMTIGDGTASGTEETYTALYQFAILNISNECTISNSVIIKYSGNDGEKEMNTKSGYVYVLYSETKTKYIYIIDSTGTKVYNIKGNKSNNCFD